MLSLVVALMLNNCDCVPTPALIDPDDTDIESVELPTLAPAPGDKVFYDTEIDKEEVY